MRAREGVIRRCWATTCDKLYPISFAGQSDTATFDNAPELLDDGGYPISHADDDDDPLRPGEQHHDGRAPRLL